MYQQPPPGYPMPPGMPPPKQNNVLKPILIGCAGLFVLLLVAGGIGTFFAWHAIGRAIDTSSSIAKIAKSAADSAQTVESEAGASPSAEQAAKAGTDALKTMIGGGKANVATLSREELKAFLPTTVGALARSSSESSSNNVAGISGTSASANYGGTGDGSIAISLIDAANMAGLTVMANIVMNVESENDEGYEKTVELSGTKVHEKWENSNKHAELIGIVGDRFYVDVTTNGVDMSVAEQAYNAIDIAKLLASAASTAQK